MTIKDIPDLLTLLDSGTYRESDVLFMLCKLTAHEDIDALLRALPDEWRRRFSSWMIESYDNDTPPSSFIMLDSAVGEVPEKAVIIGRIREWIAASRSTASQGQHVLSAADRRKRMLELVQRAHENSHVTTAAFRIGCICSPLHRS